jgi:hypothetical protein
MNPIFVFLVILGAALLWLIFAFAFRLIGGIAMHLARRAEKAMSDEMTKPEAFMLGLKDSLHKSKGGDESNE